MGLFSKKENTCFALIDIDSSSIGGALMHVTEGTPPLLYYTARISIEAKEHESSTEAMLRTLHDLAEQLVTKGGPILRKETGSGHIDRILVSVGAPWQKTTIRIETIEDKKPFLFTKALMADATHRGEEVPKGYTKSSESVIATLLNGYETPNPFGKKVSRADLMILSSLLDASVAKDIERLLRTTYHTHALTLTAFAPVAYSVFRDLYPHEKDFLVLDVSGEATDIAFVKHGLLENVATVEYGINNLIRGAQTTARKFEKATPVSSVLIDPTRNANFAQGTEEVERMWLEKVTEVLGSFASRSALPRTLFLLASPETRDYLRNTLDSRELRTLWLTDDPLRVISVVPTHFANFIKTRGVAEGDVFLSLLTLFAAKMSKISE
jgi:hypothetical protein